jgi:CBS-domain-containing membrane protein
MKLETIVNKKPVTIHGGSLEHALLVMQRAKVRHLTVTDYDTKEVQGIISRSDILPFAPPQQPEDQNFERFERLEEKLAEMKVRDYMQKKLVRINEDSNITAEEAIKLFYKNDLGHPVGVLILTPTHTNKTLSGTISVSDVLKMWEHFPNAEKKGETHVEAIGSPITGLASVSNQSNVLTAVFILGRYHQRYLTVLDSSNTIMGFYEDTDLMYYTFPENIAPSDGDLEKQQIPSHIQMEEWMKPITTVYQAYDLGKRTVSADTPIWSSDPKVETVVKKFLDRQTSILGYERMTALLVRDKKNQTTVKYVTLLDCIKHLAR